MKAYFLLFGLLCLVSYFLYALFGDDSYTRLRKVQETLAAQHARNAELEEKVVSLQEKIHALQVNPRTLEIEARERTGLARPNEMIFKFDQ